MTRSCSVIVLSLALIAACLPAHGWTGGAAARSAQSTDTGGGQLNAAALEPLVGRIALYPDGLSSAVLPVSTQPLQIVEARRFFEQYKASKSLKPLLCGIRRSWRCSTTPTFCQRWIMI